MPIPPRNELADLVSQALAGSNEATQILFDKWRKPLLHVIRTRMDPRLRRIFDSDDFVQEAMAAAFARALVAGDFDSPERFLAYLKTIAENKVRDSARKYLLSQRSNINREVPLEQAQATVIRASDQEEDHVVEEIARLRLKMAELPLVERAIMNLLAVGHKPAAIAQCLKIDVDFVSRRIESAKRTVKNDWLMARALNMTKACPPTQLIPL